MSHCAWLFSVRELNSLTGVESLAGPVFQGMICCGAALLASVGLAKLSYDISNAALPSVKIHSGQAKIWIRLLYRAWAIILAAWSLLGTAGVYFANKTVITRIYDMWTSQRQEIYPNNFEWISGSNG